MKIYGARCFNMFNDEKNVNSNITSIFDELDLIYESEKKILLENMSEEEFIKFFEKIYYKYEDAFKRLA